ncbi:hypothetical protein, partial [Nostoc sp. CHAB 5715]|uniref:hypothetical protein n=1 Tax=Nostoc sp. CHAB 5715 TaxID=2780400 RepID=UPI001E40D169
DGISPTRLAMHKKSDELAAASDFEEFSRQVIAAAKWDGNSQLVIDGIRHVEALSAVCKIVSPIPLVLIYIDIDKTVQINRFKARDGLTENDLREYEGHQTELAVATALRQAANFIVDGNGPIDHVLDQVMIHVVGQITPQ